MTLPSGTKPRFVYSFGDGVAEAAPEMHALVGAKGERLAEMTRLGLPVPPGFTITTQVCEHMLKTSEFPAGAREQIQAALTLLEARTETTYGDPDNPLLLSVRPATPVTAGGMLEAVLNVGMNRDIAVGLAARTGDERYAWDCYRRYLQDYAAVCMGMRRGILETLLERAKDGEGVYDESELSAPALEGLTEIFKRKMIESSSALPPDDPREQLWASIEAVFRSWNSPKPVGYRNAHGLPHDHYTAVTVQLMVFGNMGEHSATGMAFTRDPDNGEKRFFGEWLPNAQGEDVRMGLRAPQPLNKESGTLPGDRVLEREHPEAYRELTRAYRVLESHFRDMLRMAFTIQQNKLWIIQTRIGKRSPRAEVRIAVDLAREGIITTTQAIRRVQTQTLDKILHPQIDTDSLRDVVARGLGASPGAATGHAVFSSKEAVEWAGRGLSVVLVRSETTPDDIHGMLKSAGILTRRGGMTSHAAVVARGASRACIVGCLDLELHPDERYMMVGDQTIAQGDIITIDGTSGSVMVGEVETVQPKASRELEELLAWVDDVARLRVYVNADTARDCERAVRFGAKGVGLCRTEHMFFETGRIDIFRQMIVAEDEAPRREALAKLMPMQKADFKAIFRVMRGLPVTIRLLDPPLHEFVPHGDREIGALAEVLGDTPEVIRRRLESMSEINPMLGHRGCRLGLTYPEIYEMQVRAVVEAACEVMNDDGVPVNPQIMIPLVSHVRELELLRDVVRTTMTRACEAYGVNLQLAVGTMIELPRSCLTGGQLAEVADFFSFGTNDLTQTIFGISRDDCGRFLPFYVEMGILPIDPFVSLDPSVGELVEIAVERGRAKNPGLELGMCGEHGGDPRSIAFCHKAGLDYVSCSPFRVPIARLAAAQAALEASS